MKVSKVVYGDGLTVEALCFILSHLDKTSKVYIHKDHTDKEHHSLVAGGMVIKQTDLRGKSPNLEGVFETFFREEEVPVFENEIRKESEYV